MGCTTSCIAPSVAELNKSLKAGDERKLLETLASCPKLLSTCTTMLSPTAVTPLHVACENKQVKVVEQVISFLSCSALDVVREALAPYCRRAGKPLPTTVHDGVRLAVNMANAKGQTPLMYACFAGCPELVKFLLKHDADPWAGDRCGNRTPLHYAALGGSSACIAALMKHVPPRLLTRQTTRYVNARSCCGLTPLHYSAFFGHVEAIRELLHHDPNINATTTSESYDVSVTCEVSSSPLHFAAVRGNEAAARELLQYYAQRLTSGQPISDPRVREDAAGQLPWQVALAHHPANLSLAASLHPGQNIHRALGMAGSGRSGTPHTGPASLASIAAAALREVLLAQVQTLKAAQEAPAPCQQSSSSSSSAQEAAGQQAAVAPAAAGTSNTCAQTCATDSEAAGLRCSRSGTSTSNGGSCGDATRQLSDLVSEAEAASCVRSRSGRLAARVGRCASGVSAGGVPAAGAAAGDGNQSGEELCSTPLPGSISEAAPTSPRRGRAERRVTAAASTSPTPADGSSSSSTTTTSADSIVTTGTTTRAAATSTCSGTGVCEQQRPATVAACAGRTAPTAPAVVDDDEDELCGVCFAAQQAVAPAGCGHGLCVECAAQLCRGISRKPLCCPFCRQVVRGLVPYDRS